MKMKNETEHEINPDASDAGAVAVTASFGHSTVSIAKHCPGLSDSGLTGHCFYLACALWA